MLSIYICDDEQDVREELKKEVERQIMIGDWDMAVALSTGDPEHLLAALYENPRRSIYFLDVDLKRKNLDGFLLGKEIRRRDPRGFLIYVTSYKDLAFQTFQYHLEAMDYIVKGNPMELARSIRDCLQTIVRRMKEEQNGAGENSSRYYTVHTGGSIRHSPLEAIICFETAPGTHRILLHAVHDCIDFTGQLSEIHKEVGEGFFRSHRSFLVNRDRIRQINQKKNELVMDGGMVCLLSRTAKGNL